MVDSSFLKWLYVGSFTLCVIAVVVSYIIWSLDKSLGIAVGYVIGLLPFLSWHWVLRKTNGFQVGGNKRLILLVTFGKYLVIAGSLYFILTHRLLDVIAIVVGMFITFLVVMVLGIVKLVGSNYGD